MRHIWMLMMMATVMAQGGPAPGEITVPMPGAFPEAVLFPFDSHALPFRHGLELRLLSARRRDEPVLGLGEPGTPDSGRISYYGTVIRVGDELRMWYLGHSAEELTKTRICYAVSRDGIHWERPALGLVDYRGSKANNLVDVDFGGDPMSCTVLHEPDDPDPGRRFKMFAEARPEYRGNVAFSADGLTWTPSPRNPVTHARIEPTGLVRRDGMYYVTGQNANVDIAFQKRVLMVAASRDFEHWGEAVALGFRRDSVPPRPVISGYASGKQVHIGAGLWDRGNVVLGFYGMWDMPDDSLDRRELRMDIGLVLTHDGIHYREPVPDFRIIPGFEEGWEAHNPRGYPPALAQGQGVEQIGDETVTWYGVWGSENYYVATASWDRDRLGYFKPERRPLEGQTWVEGVNPHFISAPIRAGQPVALHVNADRLGEHTRLVVDLLDEGFMPLPGYGRAEAVPLDMDGFRIPVRWSGSAVADPGVPFRIRVTFDGVRPEDGRVFAVYAGPAGDGE